MMNNDDNEDDEVKNNSSNTNNNNYNNSSLSMEQNSDNNSIDGIFRIDDESNNGNGSNGATMAPPPGIPSATSLFGALRGTSAGSFEEYRQTDTDDDEDDDDNDGILNTSNNNKNSSSSSSSRKWIYLGILLLVILIIISFTSKENQKLITPGTSSSANTDEDDIDDDEEECTIDANSKYYNMFQLEGLEHGAVASPDDVCSQMGTKILLSEDGGGNAIDASITVALCLGVVNPSSSGIGGGAFMLIHSIDNPKTDNNIPDYIDARDNNATNSIFNNNNVEVIDCREVAPSNATTYMYENLSINASVYGGLAIPIFGELKCLELAHSRYGKLSWKNVVLPVVELARAGITVNKFLAKKIKQTADIMLSLDNNNNNDFNELRTIITKDDNWEYPLQHGDIMKNRPLIELLNDIAEYGVTDTVYSKSTAETLVKEIQDYGGIITVDDIINYKAIIRTPIYTTNNIFGGNFNVVGIPPPSSGGATIIAALKFLSGFITTLSTFHDTLSKHQIIESLKHAFAIRMSLSDPNYNTDTVLDAIYDMTQGSYMDNLRKYHYKNNETLSLSHYGGDKWAQLNDNDDVGGNNSTDSNTGGEGGNDDRKNRKRRQLLQPFGYLNDHGTSHFSIIDSKGNAVAMTSSINTGFGSHIVSPSTGILFSNTMDDFAKPNIDNVYGIKPSESNYIEPGKRPLSSMSPTMVFYSEDNNNAEDETTSSSSSSLGKLMVIIGASGGPKIITSVLQVLINHIVFGRPLLESIAQARMHEQLIYHGADVTVTENTIIDDDKGPDIVLSQRTKDALIKRGHAIIDDDFIGNVQAISIDFETNTITAACDPRKGGAPAGY